ncbi:12444_t:CDS:10 [Ambispora leptoticha]|uniref:12444_t:CDS:1 n=1 Tax=Ambispora leptoticha TaxID=144679 RepID=A0A9N8VY99_9GLOM|nr:12444_t:CDS:10 [Ambispora leptoticha]
MEEETANINRTPLEHIFRLPFEFDENDRLGPWDILISEDAIKYISHLESLPMIENVMKNLRKISSGTWNKHRLNNMISSFSIPVYELELHDHDVLKIIWQVDSGFSVRSYLLTQIVKVWTITDSRDQIDKTLNNLRMLHQVYTDEQSYRCTIRQIGKNGIILPKIFEEGEKKSTENKFYSSRMDDERLLEVHKMLVTNKFIPLSKNLFKSAIMGGNGFTFQVSKVEHEIINNPTSTIIVGRSGTGKTTCIVFRLFASYINNSSYPFYKTPFSTVNNDEDISHKRQIFITVSHNLCRRVKEHFYKLQESAILAKTEISIDQFRNYLRKKEEESRDADTNNNILCEEDEDEDLNSIPNSFSRLTEDHFPLFITYKKFSKMLEGTYEIDVRKFVQQQDFDDNVEDTHSDEEGDHNLSLFNRSHFVDYDAFKERYWKCFDDNKLNRELVYSEFSVIKGSNPEGKYLSRTEYQTISTKKYPVFCHNRDKIYDLFLQYEKKKKRNGDYDSIDRTLAILRCAKEKEIEGLHIHEIYIDECQDNQIVDFGLIFKIFDRVDSIFLAGDIAQCIAKGSSFRFQDIRSLIYKWELNRIQANNIRRSDIKPNQFELNINYRSHSGILRLAASIIDLIERFFPESIDRLPREHSEVGGPRPIVFKGFQDKTYFDVFSVGKTAENNNVFGAEQVIIVRDEESKSLINKEIGIVMTVYEAKGMEFNDVLLYNFFTNSPGRQKWRLILSALENQHKGIQTFSHEKHYILSSELKHLYVAITRARRHIWIFDEKNEYIEPICKYWEHNELVKVIQSEVETITFSTLGEESSSTEWDKKGKKLFELRQYEQAIFCFKKSENSDNLKIAEAYHLQQIARASINYSDRDTIISNFSRAAGAFLECARLTRAALCYEDIDMYEKAAEVYKNSNMFEDAARCFLKVRKFEDAGKYFKRANKYTDSVDAYNKGRCYEKIIKLMQREKIDEEVFNCILRLINIHYRKEKDREMSEKALSVFAREEQINFLQELYYEEFLEFCEKNVDLFRVVVEDSRSRGRFSVAVDMFPRMVYKFPCLINDEEDTIEYLRCCLYLCRVKVLDFVNPNFAELKDRLLMANNIITKIKLQDWKRSEEGRNLKEEFQLYLAYLNSDLDEIRKLMQSFNKRGDRVIEFRAIIIRLHISSSDVQAENWQERLQCLLRICELAFLFIAPQDYENKTKIHQDFQDIFVVDKVEKHPYKRKISFDNHLIHILNQNYQNNAEISDGWHAYDEKILNLAISQFLASYIYKHILEAVQKDRKIQNISSELCFKIKHNHRKHHVISTPSILRKHFSSARLQYNVREQLYALYNGLTYIAHKIWLPHVIDNCNDLSVMLKCMLFLHKLQDYGGIKNFDQEMSQKIIWQPKKLPIGFVYHLGYDEAVPVGRRLSLFFSNLSSNRVLNAIMHVKTFIQYTIDNSKLTNINTPDTLGELISLMEFKTSLLFAAGPGYCDFCLPQAYLVNYFNAFTAKPLVPHQHSYNRSRYLTEIKSSIDQVQQLLNLIFTEQVYLTNILRLIRLLVLICINEPTSANKVFDLFVHWYNDKVFSPKLLKYLNKSSMDRLAIILHDDLKETDCESLVIVHYHSEASSKFSDLEKHGIVKLKYTSVKEFHIALKQIVSSKVTEKSTFSNIPINQLSWKPNDYKQNNEKFPISNEAQVLNKETQVNKSAKDGPILEKISNEMIIFCKDELLWKVATENKGKEIVNEYHTLLKDLIVKNIVDLREVQGKMDSTKIKLQKAINNCNSDDQKIDELLDELEYVSMRDAKFTVNIREYDNASRGKHRVAEKRIANVQQTT